MFQGRAGEFRRVFEESDFERCSCHVGNCGDAKSRVFFFSHFSLREQVDCEYAH